MILTSEEIEAAFENTNFGYKNTQEAHLKLLKNGCLKRMVGYHCGYTLTTIMYKLGLTTKSNSVSAKGIKFMYESFYDGGFDG